MEKTTITQNNTQVLTAPEVYEYKIETSVTDKGELPCIQIFVFTISDPSDPSLDKFARVAVPGDFDGPTALLIARDAAILAGATEFLASYFSVQYPDLTVAVQAKSAITTRINELINGWIVYRDNFIDTSGIAQYFPTTDPALEQSLIDDYAGAKQARIAAEEDVTISVTDLTLAQKDAANAQKIYEIYKKEVDFCQTARMNNWLVLNSALSTLFGANATFITNSRNDFCGLAGALLGFPVTWPPDPATVVAPLAALPEGAFWTNWISAITTIDLSWNAFNTVGAPQRSTLDAEFQSFCITAAGNTSSSYNAKVAADSDVADAVTNKKEAEAALVSAQKAEEAALATVMEVCPTFDPASV